VLPLRAAVGALLLVTATGCGKAVRPDECRALLDRYVEKLVGSDRPGLSTSEIFRLQGEARRKAAQDPAFRDCPKEVSRRQMDCALQAETLDRMEICLY